MTHIRYLTMTIAAAAFAATGVAAIAHDDHDHDHASGVVRERMETMTTMNDRVKAISQRVRANKDLAAIPGDARAIRELAGKVLGQFPAGSIQHPTRAKPEIWQKWPDFESKAKALETASEKLMSIDVRDAKSLAAQVRVVSDACADCHGSYRARK